jgi:hypothetical protein
MMQNGEFQALAVYLCQNRTRSGPKTLYKALKILEYDECRKLR